MVIALVSRTPRYWTALLLLTVLAVGPVACSPVPKLPTIDAASVPAAIREHAVFGAGQSDIIWHVCDVQGDRVLAISTLTITHIHGSMRLLWIGCFDRVGESYLRYNSIATRQFPPEQPFAGTYTRGGSSDNLFAAGVAYDRQISRVVGVTSSGREVFALRHGQFWALRPPGPELPANDERWVSIKALDRSGNVLHELTVRTVEDPHPGDPDWGEPEFAEALDPAVIPDRVKAAIASLDHTEVIWYACSERDGMIFTVFTAARSTTLRPGWPERTLELWVFEIRPDGSLAGIVRHVDVPYKQPPVDFAVSWGVSGDAAEQTLRAAGTLKDPRVTKISGRTTGGVEVEFWPVNGFWILWVDALTLLPGQVSPSHTWEEINALDDEGNALHTWRPRRIN